MRRPRHALCLILEFAAVTPEEALAGMALIACSVDGAVAAVVLLNHPDICRLQ